MSLAVGTRLGSYEISGQLGAGGMGEVYRARDTRLGREVALKTLPSAVAEDSDRLARFEREAKLLAALNHANIAAIYGLEALDGAQCIAMELVEGETLEQKLKDGAFAVEDALQIALQIAQALEAAHEKGVVHRDLKPANVMVTAKGQVKVLDFGLGKAFAEDANASTLGQSPALSLAMTQQGIILGTAGYMSPEQASGQATDQRADIWAFGVVLFEMLSGLPLFVGESVPHILADVLKTEPDWKRLPKNLHPRLMLSLQRCLEKKPYDRYHAIADARSDIEAVLRDPEAAQLRTDSPRDHPTPALLPKIAAAVLLTAAVSATFAWTFRPERAPLSVNRFAYDLPGDLTIGGADRRMIAISPDGRSIAYNTTSGVYLRSMSELDSRALLRLGPGVAAGVTVAGALSFSPDSQWIAYQERATGRLMRVAVSGGAPVVIGFTPGALTDLSWAEDGMLYFGIGGAGVPGSGTIYRVAANAGTPEPIIQREESNLEATAPRLLPDGDSVLFTLAGADFDTGQIVVQSLATGERKVLLEGGSDARYLPTGHLVYSVGNALFAVAFDMDGWIVSGGPVPVLQSVLRAAGNATAATQYDVSNDGTLVYVVGDVTEPKRTLAWVDRSGREEPLSAEPRAYTYPRLSPDGTQLALDVRDQNLDIWIWDFAREGLTRLTLSPDQDEFPVWSPDGSRIAFSSAVGTAGTAGGSRVSWQAADGSSGPELIFHSEGQLYTTSFLPDGTGILARSGTNANDDIAVIRLGDGEARVEPLLTSSFAELNGEISPDGHWLAYSSNESGDYQVYVRPFPDVDTSRSQISTSGGTHAAWSRDGKELFFRNGDSLLSATVQTEPTFSASPPKVLFTERYFSNAGDRTYDVSLDGERFLMIKEAEEGAVSSQIIIVQNWFEELRRFVPAD